MTYFKRAILTPIRKKIRKKEQKSIDAVTKIKTKSDIKKSPWNTMHWKCHLVKPLQKTLKDAGEMAQWIRSLTAPPEDLDSITCSHMVVYVVALLKGWVSEILFLYAFDEYHP